MFVRGILNCRMRITQLFTFHFYLSFFCLIFKVITSSNDLVWSSSPLVPTPYRGFKPLLLVLSLLRSSGLKALPWGRRSLNRIRFACVFKFCLGVLQKHLTWKKYLNFAFCRVASILTRETIAVLDVANLPLPTTIGFVQSLWSHVFYPPLTYL